MQFPVSTDCAATLAPGAATAGAEESRFGEQFQDAQETLANQQAPSDPTNQRTTAGAVPLDFLSWLPRLDISKTLTPVSTFSMAAPSPGGAAGVKAVEPSLVYPFQDAEKAIEAGTQAGIRLAPLQTGLGKSSRKAVPKNEPGSKEEKEGGPCIAVIVPQPAELQVKAGKLGFTSVAICPAQPAISANSSIPEEVLAQAVPGANTPKRTLANMVSPLPLADPRGSERTPRELQAADVQAAEVQPIKAGTTPIQFSEGASSPLGEQQTAAAEPEGSRVFFSTSISDVEATRTHRIMDAPSEIDGNRGKRPTFSKDPGMLQIRFMPSQQTGENGETTLPAGAYVRASSPEPAESQGVPAQMRAADAYASQPDVPVKTTSQDTGPANDVRRTNVAGQVTRPRDSADVAITVNARPKVDSDSAETMPRKAFGQLVADKDERSAVPEAESGQVHSSAVRPTIWSFGGPQVSRETQPPAAEANQRPMNALSEVDRMPIRENVSANSSGPLRNISLQVGQAGQPKVEVQVTERSGEVHVAVRSGDSEVVRGLRHDLPELVNRLEDSGFTATAWRPSGVIGGTSQTSEPQQGGSEHRGQQPDSQSSGSHSHHDQRGNRHSKSQHWAEEFEGINNDIDRPTGELHGFSH